MATSIGFAKAMTRLGNFALDDSSVFTSVVSLNNYLASGTCYAGQVVALVDTTTGKAKIYKTEGLTSPFTITQIDSASISLDNISLDNNSTSKLELKGFETANNDTVVIKNGTGVLGYLAIEKNNTNSYTTVASKEYVDMLVQGGIVLQGVDYDASTNTPDITTVVIGVQAYAWHISVAGTQTLGGKTFNFKVNDWVVKTVSGGYLHIDNNTNTISWGTLSGNIVDQLDLKTALDKKVDKVTTATTNNIAIFDATGNLLDGGKKISDLVLNTTTVNGRPLNANIILDKTDIGLSNVPNTDTTNASNISSGTLPSARLPIADSTNIGGVKQGTGLKIGVDGTIEADIIDDSATTSITDTYSIDKIIALLNNKQNKITISSTKPITPSLNDIFIDTTNINQYILKVYNGTSWVQVGGSSSGGTGGTSIGRWISGNLYNVDDLVINNGNFYQCSTQNVDSIFDINKWSRIGGDVNSIVSASNIGTTKEVFKQKTGDNLEFRTLTEGTNINIVQSGDSLVISSNLTGNADNSIDYKDTLTSDFTYDNTKIDFDATNVKLKENTVALSNATKLLLHMDGTNDSTSFTDSSSTNATVITTNTKISTSQSKFGNSSAYFTNSNSILTINSGTSALDAGIGDFTMDCWIYMPSPLNSNTQLFQNTTGTTWGTNCMALHTYGASGAYPNKIAFWLYDISNSNPTVVSSTNLTTNTWYYIKVFRQSGIIKLQINDTIESTYSYTGSINFCITTGCVIGAGLWQGGIYGRFNGYLDEFRIAIGKADINKAPTIPYGTEYDTTQYNTVSLQSSKLLDASDWYQVNGVAITQNTPTNTDVKWLLDIGGTYKKWDSTNKIWVDVLLADIGTQGNTKLELESCFTNYSWSNTGFTKFGLVCALKSNDASSTPTVDKVDINFLKGQKTLDGHVIESDTQTMSQRSILHFKNAIVTDDVINDKTIVEISGGSIALGADEW